MKRKKSMIYPFLFFLFFSVAAAIGPVRADASKNASFSSKEAVKELKAISKTQDRIKLKWRKFNHASGYQIYRSCSKKGIYVRIASVKKTSFTNKKLNDGTKYYYKIRAFKKRGKSFQYSRFSSVLYIKTPKSTKSKPKKPSANTASAEALTHYLQKLDYRESTQKIQNPDQGFYQPLYVTMDETKADYNAAILKKNEHLYHLRIDISAFSKANNNTKDKVLTKEALDGLQDLLDALYKQNRNAIIRFSYAPGFSGEPDREPPLPMIITHIRQIASVLNQYPDTVTAIEAGMVGSCGEMHTSAIATPETIDALVDAFLAYTDTIPILVRTPQMIYHYLGVSLSEIDALTIDKKEKAYRLGIFNDGYLGSNTDLGTYKNRPAEVPWLAQQTGHLPYGGEVTVPGSTLHNIENCLPEMRQLHLSYLNNCWNTEVLQKWKDTFYTQSVGTDELYYGKSAYEYIENHLGYRFVLKESDFAYNKTVSRLDIFLTLENTGFGFLNKPKKMTLYFVDQNQNVSPVNAGTFQGEETITIQTCPSLKEGVYQLYLRIDNGKDHYPVQFANHLWNDALQANFIGSVSVAEE